MPSGEESPSVEWRGYPSPIPGDSLQSHSRPLQAFPGRAFPGAWVGQTESSCWHYKLRLTCLLQLMPRIHPTFWGIRNQLLGHLSQRVDTHLTLSGFLHQT